MDTMALSLKTAGAVGVGLCQSGQAMLSLGTSGVYFVVTDRFLSKPEWAVHSFCHAIPNTWHLMSVMLSATSCLDWAYYILIVSLIYCHSLNPSNQHEHQCIFYPISLVSEYLIIILMPKESFLI